MEKRLRGDIFQGLKQILRNRKMTYADLAEAMDLSEPTIKRMFVEQDCKMGRLLTLCDILEVSLSDLMDRAKRNRDTAFELPLNVERQLASKPMLFYLFILLRDGVNEDDVCARYNISKSQFFLYMRQLEEMGLARTRHDGKITVYKELRIQFQRHGPLSRMIRDLNTQFMIDIYERPDAKDSMFRTMSRKMLPDTAAFIQQELCELSERINRMARQDQLIAHEDELISYKITAAFGPFRLPEILNVTQSDNEESPSKTGNTVYLRSLP